MTRIERLPDAGGEAGAERRSAESPPASVIDVMSAEDALGIGIGDDILVVDDDVANRIAIEAALAPLGRNVVLVESGLEALARLLEQDFALIFLDIAMPEMTGIETARMIRARERTRGTPIIFITGMSWQDETIDEAYDVGGFDLLSKPVRPELLRAKVRVYLQLQERTRELQRRARQLHESQAKLHEQELREQQARALLEGSNQAEAKHYAETERIRQGVASIVGHELRNPLHALQMAFELILNRTKTSESDLAVLARRHFDRMQRITEDLLDITLLGNGMRTMALHPVDLVAIVGDAIESLLLALEKQRHTLIVDSPVEGPLLVNGDQARLRQAITILIENAARYTPHQGRIDVAVTKQDTCAVVRVTDTGRGIATELLPRIFELFVLERAGSDGFGGVGLRLAKVKRIVRLHGGSVSAESAGVGLGSTFELRLPLV